MPLPRIIPILVVVVSPSLSSAPAAQVQVPVGLAVPDLGVALPIQPRISTAIAPLRFVEGVPVFMDHQFQDLFSYMSPGFKTDLARTGIYLQKDALKENRWSEVLVKEVNEHPLSRVALDFELDMLQSMNHPNLPKIVSIFTSNDFRLSRLVLERPSFPTSQRLVDPVNIHKFRGMSERDQAKVFKGLAEALRDLHRKGIFLGNLSKDNVLVFDRDTLLPKITNFDLIVQKIELDPKAELFALYKPEPEPPRSEEEWAEQILLAKKGGFSIEVPHIVKELDLWKILERRNMAPELHGSTPIDSRGAVDVWDFGRLMWEMLEKPLVVSGKKSKMSSALTSLLNRIFDEDWESRITMEEVLQEEWFQGGDK